MGNYQIIFSNTILITDAKDETEAINKAVEAKLLTVEQVVSCNLLKK